MRIIPHLILAVSLALLIAQEGAEAAGLNAYRQTNLVANKASLSPALPVTPGFINAWGISIRPAGAGGHFWVTAKDVSYEYVGDVSAAREPKLRRLHTDELALVKLPVGGEENFATGTVFNGNPGAFSITQAAPGGPPITAGAKFIFASDGGIISGWTERKRADGAFDRPDSAITVIDYSAKGSQFFGLAINGANTRLYAADFGGTPRIHVFDAAFKPAAVAFDMPFDDNGNGKVDAGEYAPFNVQAIAMPAGPRIFVAYAKTQACPDEEVKAGVCAKGAIFPGEEDIEKPGQGRLAEFNEDGALIAVWPDGGRLSAPWGIALAPANFGAASGQLLVSNFGDGTIAAYDPKTRQFSDYLKDEKKSVIKIDKIWGLLFGNGASLGDTNALYFAAGPDDEKDGLFGSLRPVAP